MNDNVTKEIELRKDYYKEIQTNAHIFKDKCHLIKIMLCIIHNHF